MSNGTGPLDLGVTDYNLVKSGTCVTAGSYTGCILTGTTYHWFKRGSGVWVRQTGSPNPSLIVKITTTVWNQCRQGGTLTYDSSIGGWRDANNRAFQWDGQGGGNMSVVAI
jgi:hypothetical protein